MSSLIQRSLPVCLLLLIQTVSGDMDFTNMNLTQVPIDRINTDELVVDISRNLISRIENNTFVHFPRLETLRLSRNQISFISDLAFNGTAIRRLFLNSNRLTTLPRFASIGSSLDYLHLGSNQIRSLNSEVLAGVTSLRNFYISSNKLTSIHPEAFSDCANSMFRMSYFSNPQLTYLPADIFNGMGELFILDLQWVPLTSFPDFRMLPEDNKLTILYISRAVFGDLANDALHNLPRLIDLLLSNVGLTRLPDLSRQDKIMTLTLSANDIVDIPYNAFNNMPLWQLKLNGNQLTRLPNLQPVYSTLATLELGYNNFSSVTCKELLEVVTHSVKLVNVDFTGTHIDTFPDILQLNRSFISINIINSNTMRCDCAMEWMIGLEERVHTNVRGNSMPCASPPQLVGRRWSTITRTDLCQDNEAASCYLNQSYDEVGMTTPFDRVSMTMSSEGVNMTTPGDGINMMTSQVRITTTTLSPGATNSSSPTSIQSDDSGGERNVLAPALGGALGGPLFVLIIVVVVLVCRLRSSSSSNKPGDNNHEGVENNAYLTIGDGSGTYLHPVPQYSQLTIHEPKLDQTNVYDQIDDLAP